MSGWIAPLSWQGGLPVVYKLGPSFDENSELILKITINNYLEEREIHNVIGTIFGKEEPDRYVILGNHHDSWGTGAVDPHSGGAALTSLAGTFGEMLDKGIRPRRSIIFCSWDGEEMGLIGSTEWVEENLKFLRRGAVAYLNVDLLVEGHFTIRAFLSPILQDALYKAAKLVPSPVIDYENLYEMWLARPFIMHGITDEPQVSYALGSGSDHASFYQKAGVSCLDLRASFDYSKFQWKTYPTYHTNYETEYLIEKFQDPGLKFSQTVTRLWGILSNNLANSQILPFNVTRYADAVALFVNHIISQNGHVWNYHNVSTDALVSAVDNLTKEAKKLNIKVFHFNVSRSPPISLRVINDKMMNLERAFLSDSNTPDGPLVNNILFGPSKSNSYGVAFFPGIVDAMHAIMKNKTDWNGLRRQISKAAFHIQTAAQGLKGFPIT